MLKWNELMIFKLNYLLPYRVWWLYMHNSYDLPFSIEWKAAALNNDHFVVLSWKLHSFRLLEKPFKTNCLNYRLNTRHLSRKACIRDCKIKTSLKECQVVDNSIDLYKEDPAMNFSMHSEAWCIKQVDFDTICQRECPHYDCLIDYYKPVVIYNYPLKSFPLEVSIPTEPETTFHLKPKFQTIEFICYIASIFGIWFGFSLLQLPSLSTLCQHYLSKICKPCCLVDRTRAGCKLQINRFSIINVKNIRNKIRLY